MSNIQNVSGSLLTEGGSPNSSCSGDSCDPVDWRAIATKTGVKFCGSGPEVRCLCYRRVDDCDCTLVLERKQLRVQCSRTECYGERFSTNYALAAASAEAVFAARAEGAKLGENASSAAKGA